jgi:hypothetical protein
MPNTDIKNSTWPVREVLALAQCIYRQKGYTSTSTYLSSDPDGDQRWTNKDMLVYTLVPQIASDKFIMTFKATDEDFETADAIIKYFRRLSFGVIGDQLNDYMSKIFKVTQIDAIGFSDLGVLASVPQVYDRETTAKELKDQIKNTEQAFIGTEGESLVLTIKYIKTRFIPQLNCYGHEAVTTSNHLVSFLNKVELGKAGTVQKIRARVKKHGTNFTTKTLETQLNYVKVLDTELIWQ